MHDLCRAWREHPHEARVKQVPLRHAVSGHAARSRVVQKVSQDDLELTAEVLRRAVRCLRRAVSRIRISFQPLPCILRVRDLLCRDGKPAVRLDLQYIEQLIRCVDGILRFQQAGHEAI